MIKHIFCTTDFSGAAEIAAMYAANMAKAFNAELTLFHSYEPLPVIVPQQTILGAFRETSDFLERQMDDVKLLIDPMKLLRIKKIITSGPAVPNIIHQIKETRPDLVIMGMKERGKTLRKLFGSTVTGVARRTGIPLIIVPEEAIYSVTKTIMLATEMDIPADADPEMLDSLMDIGKRFRSKLYVIRVTENKTLEALELLNRPGTLMRLTKSLHPEFDCISGNNIEESLNSFVEKRNVDLLVFLAHHHSLLDRIWYPDTTKEMIFHTRVPLLILPEKHSYANSPAEKVQRAG